MGEITRAEVVAALKLANPKRRLDELEMYADGFTAYAEAGMNIAANGNIVIHPRTGAPITNPYLEIRAQGVRTMKAVSGLKADALWERLGAMLAAPTERTIPTAEARIAQRRVGKEADPA